MVKIIIAKTNHISGILIIIIKKVILNTKKINIHLFTGIFSKMQPKYTIAQIEYAKYEELIPYGIFFGLYQENHQNNCQTDNSPELRAIIMKESSVTGLIQSTVPRNPQFAKYYLMNEKEIKLKNKKHGIILAEPLPRLINVCLLLYLRDIIDYDQFVDIFLDMLEKSPDSCQYMKTLIQFTNITLATALKLYLSE